jgi:RNA polymerase sigma-70 factor (sigma-E family)
VGDVSADRDARLAALFDEHYGRLRDLAFMILGDRDVAEEIAMEAFIKTFSGWSRIRDVERADAYLRRAVVNLCRSRIRRKTIEHRVNAVSYRREERREPAWDPERHEDARRVWAAVRDLPPRQRAAIVLRYMEDLNEREIADALDCSVGTVRSQLSRARQKLQVSLAEQGL